MVRGLTLLLALGEQESGMTLTELSGAADLPKPTTLRLLRTLEEFGFVARHEGVYRVGHQCLTLGNLYRFDADLHHRALPVMERVMKEVQEVVQLGTLSEQRVLYLERVEPQRSVALVLSRPGSTRPAYCTALGKAMLAHLPEDAFREHLLAAVGLGALTPMTITTREGLLEELEKTRERGYAVDDGECDEEIGCVAAPILDVEERAVAALSVSAPRFRLAAERRATVGTLLMEAAREIAPVAAGRKEAATGLGRIKFL